MPRLPLPQLRDGVIELSDGRHLALGPEIGGGSRTRVHRAWLESAYGIRRPVAVKLFQTVASEELEELVAKVAKAARRTALVRHPNVVAVSHFDVYRAQPLVVMELVEGVALAELVTSSEAGRRRVALDLALFVATEVAEALSGARTARGEDGLQLGLLHLGLGGREVLLSRRGEVKVEGFELEGARGASSRVRSLGALAYKVRALAPEVAQGDVGDARADVFSLGLLLRELLVGPRFARELPSSEAIRLARDGFIEPYPMRPNLPASVAQVMDRALAIDPAHRYPNATAMAFDLRHAASALGVGDGRQFVRRALDDELTADTEMTAAHLGGAPRR